VRPRLRGHPAAPVSPYSGDVPVRTSPIECDPKVMRGHRGDIVSLDRRGEELREGARGIDRARGTVAVACLACRKHAERSAHDVAVSQYVAAAAPGLAGRPACAGVSLCNGAAGPAAWYKQGERS
jgi:hypothetical protein